VASNYLDRAEDTWKLVQSMPIGARAVFTVPRAPVSYTGTTLKPLFLAIAHWHHRLGVDSVDVTLVVDRPSLLGVDRLDERLTRRLHELGVRVHYGTAVTALHPDERQISVTGPGGSVARLPYDMLHLVPPFRSPRWLAASNLTRDDVPGLIDTDPRTLRHAAHHNVWAAGDAAYVDTDPSGGALRRQATILVDNLLAARAGQRRLGEYDGYTVAPIATHAHRLIAAEFDRSGTLTSSLPSFLDSLKPRRSAWAFDRFGLPQIYWNLILRGRA
jgi:sulfide:quinone oxidoreductase